MHNNHSNRVATRSFSVRGGNGFSNRCRKGEGPPRRGRSGDLELARYRNQMAQAARILEGFRKATPGRVAREA